MNNDLFLYSRIISHLEYLTTYDEFGCSRSRNVGTVAELADELNSVGIVPKRGHWTKRSLECFLPRIRQRYTKDTIAAVCDCRLVGCSAWEYLSATRKGEVISPRQIVMHHDKGVYRKSTPIQYEPIDGERWKSHELPELIEEAEMLKRLARAKKYSRRLRIKCAPEI